MIHREVREGIAILRMEHGKANAVDIELFEELSSSLDALEDARAYVLTGTGTIFSAGVNLFQVLSGGIDYLERFLPVLTGGIQAALHLREAGGRGPSTAMPLPAAASSRRRATIASWPRVVAGLASPSSWSASPFPAAALETLRALLPPHTVQRLVLTGETVAPGVALDLGLVDDLAPADQLVERAWVVAKQMADIPPESFALTKRQLRHDALERMERKHRGARGRRPVEVQRDSRPHQGLHGEDRRSKLTRASKTIRRPFGAWSPPRPRVVSRASSRGSARVPPTTFSASAPRPRTRQIR